jgi:hypothetical protein
MDLLPNDDAGLQLANEEDEIWIAASSLNQILMKIGGSRIDDEAWLGKLR